MNIQEMHYDFKLGVNKTDSQKSRNIVPAQIDFFLNKATFTVFNALYRPGNGALGFEQLHSITMELASLHRGFESEPPLPASIISSPAGDVYKVDLTSTSVPVMYITNLLVVISKGTCGNRLVNGSPTQENQLYEVLKQSHYRPSYKWRIVPYTIKEDTDPISGYVDLRSAFIYTGGDFAVNEVYLSYLRRPSSLFIGGYNSLNGEYISSDPAVSSDLPETIHDRIVQTAVKLYFLSAQDSQNYSLADKELTNIEKQKI